MEKRRHKSREHRRPWFRLFLSFLLFLFGLCDDEGEKTEGEGKRNGKSDGGQVESLELRMVIKSDPTIKTIPKSQIRQKTKTL